VVALGLAWILFGFSHTQIIYAVVGIIVFAISFFSMRAGLILMALAMLFSPEFSVGSIGIRDVTIRLEDVLIPVLGLAWLLQVTLRRQFAFFASTPINGLIGALLILSVFSTAYGFLTGWVQLINGFFYVFKTFEYFVIFFLVINCTNDEKQVEIFLWIILLTACFVGFYTLSQVPTVEIFTTHRISAPFETTPEPATIGGYMAFLLLIILNLWLYEQKMWLKWIHGGLFGILFVPLLYTLNRTSYMAFLAGIIFTAVISRKRIFIYIVIGLTLTAPFWAPASVKERIAFTWEDSKNPGRTMGVDYSSQERFYAYRRMWSTGKRSPIIGLGVTSWQTPDSQWARTIHEIGIVGLWLWFWIFFRLFRTSFWLFRHLATGRLKGMTLGYMAALLGIIIHGNGAITLYVVRIMEPFWFMTGIVVSLYMIKVREAKRLA